MIIVPCRQISKSLEDGGSVKDEGTAAKRPARYLEDDEGLEVGSQYFFSLNKRRWRVMSVRVSGCDVSGLFHSSAEKGFTVDGALVRSQASVIV